MEGEPLPRAAIEVIAIGAMKTVVFAGGRFNPPHCGHDRLFARVRALADDLADGEHLIGVVAMADGQRDPLTPEGKLAHLRRLYPEMRFALQSRAGPAFDAQLVELDQAGYDHLIMVVGEDRMETFRTGLRRINGKGPGKLTNFKLVSLVSNPRPVEGPGSPVSSTRLRQAARDGDFAAFRAMLASRIDPAQARELFDDVRAGIDRAMSDAR